MGIVIVEIGKKVIDWLLENWKVFGWPLAVLFYFLFHSSNADFTKCKADLAAERSKPVPEVKAEGKAVSTQTVRIVYAKSPTGQPAPCPDVTVDSNTLALVDAALKAPLPVPTPVPAPFWGLELSASRGQLNAPPDWAGGGSLLMGRVRVGAEYGSPVGLRYQMGVRWMFAEFFK